jgi:hypothetical protein
MSEEFRFFDWGVDPIGKYTQPKPSSESTGQNGYPEKDVDKGITKMDMRGAGAATKGKKFVSQIKLED